jgi:hypothetical protein
MKLNGSKLVAVAMVVGALGAMGCKSNVMTTDDVAPEDNAASAPVNDSASEATSSLWGNRRYYSPYAPPAARVEVRTRAPSERHFWTPGYHRWDGRRHVWYDGRWTERRGGYEYIGPRWVNSYGRWEYIPGHWQRR